LAVSVEKKLPSRRGAEREKKESERFECNLIEVFS
jgi:hypothetical protein